MYRSQYAPQKRFTLKAAEDVFFAVAATGLLLFYFFSPCAYEVEGALAGRKNRGNCMNDTAKVRELRARKKLTLNVWSSYARAAYFSLSVQRRV